MNEFVVHSIPGSPFGRAVFVALEEKSVPYRLVPVAPGSMRQPEHLALHPFGRVPILAHEDLRLYETQAILRYIDRVVAHPPLTPRNARLAAKMDQLMNINDWYLFHGVGNVIAFQRVVAPRLLGLPADEAAIAAVIPTAKVVFSELSRQLGQNSYFTGDSLSLADILLAPQLDFVKETPEWQFLIEGNTNLHDWLDRMNGRASMQATTWERIADMAEGGLMGGASAARSIRTTV
jgi:glutathione S-transferase